MKDGYESENNAMSEWVISNEKGYVKNLFEGKPYCIEHYDARFNGDDAESIVEIWLPVKKGEGVHGLSDKIRKCGIGVLC